MFRRKGILAMKCSAAGFILLLGLAGCHAPQPSLNLLAPYGTPRVPPPPTNSAGTSLSQHEGGSMGPTTVAPGMQRVPAMSTRHPTDSHTPSYLAGDGSWISIREKLAGETEPLRSAPRSTRTGDVRLSSFQENLPPVEARAPSAGTATLEWQTPPIRSATQPAIPGTFEPQAGAAAISSALPAEAVRTVSATAKSSDAQPAGAPAASSEREPAGGGDGAATLQWRDPN